VNLGPAFDLVNFVPIQGGPGGFTGRHHPERRQQELIDRYNVTSLALEVPIACLTGTGGGIIGGWTTASLPQASCCAPTRRSRLRPATAAPSCRWRASGMPLVNELVIGLPQKDLFNAAEPTGDMALADYVTNPTFPASSNASSGRGELHLGHELRHPGATNFPRADLVATFLTGHQHAESACERPGLGDAQVEHGCRAYAAGSSEHLRRRGRRLAGFPNGRRPGDDVVDIVCASPWGGSATLCRSTVCRPRSACAPRRKRRRDGRLHGRGAHQRHTVGETFPYLNAPLRGSPRPQDRP
jgi:hypothetical protein